jgi:hypothetical protein
MRARSLAIVLALIGIAFAAFVEYGTVRAADVERSFALFVFEAGPWAVMLVMLALDVYAYYAVFVLAHGEASAVIYLYKPFYGLALVGAGVLAGFLMARAGAPRG